MKTIYYIIQLILIVSISHNLNAQSIDVIYRWHETDKLIRNGKIDKVDAIDSIKRYVPLAVSYCKTLDVPYTERNQWVFPISGWTAIVYRTGGKDYRVEKFDYFQGGESKGHPAHDIFILDKDSNTVEDSTGKKIEATAMVSGVVISILNDWKPGNFLRSGNYVKLFDPISEAIFYYSHLDTVFVRVGQIVRAGESVGYVGRTGRKALRGKTHIHIAYYKIEDGEPKPTDIIEDLYAAEKRIRK